MARQRRVAAGDLTKLVAWESYNAARTDAAQLESGQRVHQFDPMGEHWAKIEPLRGAALINASAIFAVRYLEVTMQGGVGPVKALDRLIYQGRALYVHNVNDDLENGAYLSIQVSETPLDPAS